MIDNVYDSLFSANPSDEEQEEGADGKLHIWHLCHAR